MLSSTSLHGTLEIRSSVYSNPSQYLINKSFAQYIIPQYTIKFQALFLSLVRFICCFVFFFSSFIFFYLLFLVFSVIFYTIAAVCFTVLFVVFFHVLLIIFVVIFPVAFFSVLFIHQAVDDQVSPD